MAEPVIRAKGICKTFPHPVRPLTVLEDVSLDLAEGDALAVTGPSGSGKSTLLHIVGTLDQPTSGELFIEGKDPFELSEPDLAAFRNGSVGFVFQDHHLLPQYSVLENVLLPTLAGSGTADHESWARKLLEKVGLSERLDHRPAELSGGERQRVAIARALINKPKLLLCDEPTGNLDQATAGSVADLLFELHGQVRSVLVLVTHSPQLARRCPIRKELRNGRLLDLSA